MEGTGISTNFLADLVRRHEVPFVFISLGVLIIGFNYPDIFSAKTMYVDDNHRYILGLENRIHETIFRRNTLRALVLFPLYKLMAINLVYARLAQTVLFYIPLALTWYYLLRYYTKLPVGIAFSASILPCVLPGQTQIPSFIDGSYTVQGLLVFVVALHFAYIFLQQNGFLWRYFFAAFLLYGASLEMMDHAVFLAPFAIISFIGVVSWKAEKGKIISLASVIAILAIAKSIQILVFPTVSASVPGDPSLEILITRLGMLARNTVPFSFTLSGKAINIFVIWSILLVLLFFALAKSNKREKYIILYGILWVICSSFAIVTISRFYSPRLAHISGFGVNFIIVVSVYIIAKNFNNKYINYLSVFLIGGIVLFSGVSRIHIVNKIIKSPNKFHAVFTRMLHHYELPKNAQLVVLEGSLPTGGWWNYSTGYLKYATKREDITGLVGPEVRNYDPFNPQKRGFQQKDKMSGLALSDPIYIFKFEKHPDYSFAQKEFALQTIDDSWKVYKLNKITGSSVEVATGTGEDDFHIFLTDHNLSLNDVAFSQGISPGS